MIRTLPLLLLLACSGPDRPDSESPTTGSTSSGSPAGTPAGTPSTTPLREPVWNEFLQDDVWSDAPDLHHPTHARMPDGRSAVFFDITTADNEAKVMVRTFEPDLTPTGDPVELATVDGSFGRPDGGPVPATQPGGDTGYQATWHTAHDVIVGRLALEGTLEDTVQVNDVPGVDVDRGQPDLTVLPDGTTVVVYHLSDLAASPVSRYYTRHWTADLLPLGPPVEIAVSEQVGSPPDIATDPSGGYVVAWSTRTPETGTVVLTWYDDAGLELDSLRVDESPLDETPSRPNVAILPNGTLAVTWRVQDNDGTPLSAWARLYTPDHAPLTDPILLQAGGGRPNVAPGPELFLFTWEPGDSDRIKAQAFDGRTGEALENPWEPLAGQIVQRRSQASFAPFTANSWSVMFTADRGAAGSRSLTRGVYELSFREP